MKFSTIQKFLQLAFSFVLLTLPMQVFAQTSSNLKVVTTIRPLHSITARIMKGVAVPYLLLGDNQPAHDAVLKPSQAKLLATADILFWIGPELETFLINPIRSLADNSEVVSLLGNNKLQLLHSTGSLIDPHIWLSTGNAQIISALIKDTLIKIDPANRQTYLDNFATLEKELTGLKSDISTMLISAQSKKFLIYHNALAYFGKEFDVEMRSVSPGNEVLMPSAKQISDIRRLLRSGDYSCIFTDPLINSSAIASAAGDAKLNVVILDPLGSNLEPGLDLYVDMMKNISRAIADC
ncbi:MAG: metal ABC transporter substrate-binding protein [Rhizobiaceae bacterium]|nr:metal ABC transporter substrate-binding protein [Rhizobiaceae bacterium]